MISSGAGVTQILILAHPSFLYQHSELVIFLVVFRLYPGTDASAATSQLQSLVFVAKL